MTQGRWLVPALVLILLGQACAARRNAVVLLADPDGKVGQVKVSNAAGSQDLSRDREATMVASGERPPGQPFIMDEKEIKAVFGSALEAQPSPPVRFLLYFLADSAELTDESRLLLGRILEAVSERRSVDIGVIGHTDTAGDKEYNYKLSLRRAQAVGNMLVSRGVDPGLLEITSHGEENPLVKTGDNAVEPRNRLVEVIVR